MRVVRALDVSRMSAGIAEPSSTTSPSGSPSVNHEEQVPQSRALGAPPDAGETAVEKLERLGVRGILRQLARDGQIIDVRCEMPQCYIFRGRSYFEPRSARSVKAGRNAPICAAPT